MDEQIKKSDESWKEAVEKEKQAQAKEPVADGASLPVQADFTFFVTTLSIQAAIALGSMPNPATQQVESNLNQAKLIIDTLAMIKEKTHGNLNAEEDSLIDNMLYDLRMQYVEKTKPPIQ
ncbi:MAG: DUF1844 domain-containing protein [Candidatus Omnitrophica bacterium]|jgi:hypothetical protein|nr:DUF1844 domain-containing protein [Candidatus Omnitrophota bacterium]MDD5078956.1 DUF1844 domain-containing protein [Candidatus Omnitrophota bacterium]